MNNIEKEFRNLLDPSKPWDMEMLRICLDWNDTKTLKQADIDFLIGGINHLLRLRRKLNELIAVCDTIIDIRKKGG